jgi:putative transposase
VKFELVDAEKANFPVQVLCEVLEVSRSGYYAWRDRAPSSRTLSDAELRVEIGGVHKRSKRRYGSPRVFRALRRRGFKVSEKRVARLMREDGLVGLRKKAFRRTTDSNHDNPIAPNLVQRQFTPSGANQVWAGDVTYISTDEGWSYLAVLLDLYSRRVVGWAMSATNDTALALDALRMAEKARRNRLPGLVHHTDRGSPYASDDYRKAVTRHGMVQSMSRKGDCWDNAVAESFFATLRAELVEHERYAARRAAEQSIGEFIERFYNVERLHSHLDYVSPVEFELKTQAAAVAA